MNGNKKWLLSLFLGFGISSVCLYLVLRGVYWDELLKAWYKMEWWWALAAVSTYLFGQWLRGIRCSWILRPYRKISTWDATQVVWIGYAANNILPARLGEFVRSYVLTRREKLDYGISLSTLFIERILDGLAIVGILWVAISFSPRYAWIDSIGWVAGGIFSVALLVVLLARIWANTFRNLLSWAASWLPAKISGKIENFGHRLLEGTACLQWDRRLPGILGLSLLIWLIEGAMFAIMLLAFGWKFSLLAACLAMAITNLGVLIPSSPGHIGTFHAFCTKVLLLTGIVTSESMGFGYAAAIHVLQLVPVTVLGLWSLYAYGFNLRLLWSMHESKTQAHTQAQPANATCGIVEYWPENAYTEQSPHPVNSAPIPAKS